MTPSDLLERMAATFKGEVGPAIEAEYPRTQAFLSAVVLQKLAAQLRLAAEHGAAEDLARDALRRDLEQLLRETEAPLPVRDAFLALAENGDDGLCQFIEALYAAREELGETQFEALLSRVRQTM
ncbi:MAG: hypothetical protein QGF09_12720, partial [Rhodospirillales bacterium]|nr:hypothetical protein [Rhodospirillales bacterium]